MRRIHCGDCKNMTNHRKDLERSCSTKEYYGTKAKSRKTKIIILTQQLQKVLK